MWGEGAHKVDWKGKRWIFHLNVLLIFFNLKKMFSKSFDGKQILKSVPEG